MRARLLRRGVLFSAVLLWLAACNNQTPGNSSSADGRQPEPANVKLDVPADGAYTGAYLDFGDFEDNVTLEAIEAFEKLVGKHQAIISFSSFWERENFPKKQVNIISAYGAVPLIYWSPWAHSESQQYNLEHYNLDKILAGQFDSYLDLWADGANEFRKPLLVAWGIEMNGNWFPWSGYFYGAGKPVPGPGPQLFEGPEKYKRAFKYVVDHVRARGVQNVEWLFHVNNSSDPDEPWNTMAQYYPGPEYVDWLALSAYGQQFPNLDWAPFDECFPAYYHQLEAVDSSKPILLAEFGVGHFPQSGGSMAAWLETAFDYFSMRAPRLKGAVFWHERWQNGDKSYSNLRLTASDEAVQVYRQAVKKPFWLDHPVFIPNSAH